MAAGAGVRLTALALLVLAAGCASRGGPPPPAAPFPDSGEERGIASWYGEPYHGRRTASGEVYDMNGVSAAHRTLPFGSLVRVTREDTGDWVEVRVNDRGPFIEGRVIDLSYGAAKRIGLHVDGIAPVRVRLLGRAEPEREPPPRSLDPPPVEACWWVQVGAFGDIGNARRARERLARSGEPAVVMEGPGGLDRVRAGPYNSETAARDARLLLLPDWPEAAVVPCG